MTITKCPDCGACPAESRCDCDFAGVRVRREMERLRGDVARLTAERDSSRAEHLRTQERIAIALAREDWQ